MGEIVVFKALHECLSISRCQGQAAIERISDSEALLSH